MWDWVREIDNIHKVGTSAVLVTVVSGRGSVPREVGAKMIVLAGGKIRGTIGGGNLEHQAIDEAIKCLKVKQSKLVSYPLGAKAGQCCGGTVDLFFDVLGTEPHLYIFGAGHVGQAVANTLKATPFQVHIIDDRKEWIEHEDLSKNVVRHHAEWMDFVREIIFDREKTYVLVMTHSHAIDQDIIEYLAGKPAKYVGLIGSKPKWKRFTQRLTAKDVALEKLQKVKCPIGLIEGGKSPQEVAISVAAELLKEYHDRAQN